MLLLDSTATAGSQAKPCVQIPWGHWAGETGTTGPLGHCTSESQVDLALEQGTRIGSFLVVKPYGPIDIAHETDLLLMSGTFTRHPGEDHVESFFLPMG